ncbi:MAG: MarR family winged helix-turn-helix transcriptional regulator [Zoogloeaceae bacterium]|jgi:DNA-binding MarR family transcriptional regulator|nr:MarR family winged helix-turn-helix transcriptional regulator [Zoogloeaceae bacterium]
MDSTVTAAAEFAPESGTLAAKSAAAVTAPTPLDVLKQFRGIFSTVKQHFQQMESAVSLSGSQLWTLSIVARQPGVRISDLARVMGIHQSTSSNLVDCLYRQKLIIKQRTDEDQRVVRLYPTERGQSVLRDAPQPQEGILPDALNRLPAEDLARLHVLLGKLFTLLKISCEKTNAKEKRLPEPDGTAIPLAELAKMPIKIES